MTLIFKILVISLIILTTRVDYNLAGGKILAIFPIPHNDNQLTFVPLVERLIEKGHHLTILTTNPHIFLNQIKYENSLNLIDLSFTNQLEILNELKSDNILSGSDMLRQVFRVMRTVAEAQLESLEIQEFLRNDSDISYRKRFDAVLVDWSGPCLMNAFANKFNIPLIGITPGGAYMTSHEAIGNPNHPVLFPSVFMPFSENLSLLQKIASVIFSYRYRNIYFNEELPLRDEIIRKIFGENTPSLWEIQSNADLLLVNSYQALGNSRPIGPTTIHLGGIHAKTTSTKLPKDLENFLNTAINNVVYINLGEPMTRVIIHTERYLEKLIKIMEMSRFDVVWNMNGIFQNDFNSTIRIYQNEYIEQEDVLAHPNVKLFITLGGQRDVEDAIHHKVPCFGLTFSSSIEHYLLQIVKNEAGLISNFDLESSEELFEKIEKLSITDRYERNMMKLNQLVNDQPMPSVDRAVWWIEYVLRNNGTKSLKNSWNTITWFEYLLMDVILTILIVTFIVIGVLTKIYVELRKYSKSLPFERITRRSLLAKEKML